MPSRPRICMNSLNAHFSCSAISKNYGRDLSDSSVCMQYLWEVPIPGLFPIEDSISVRQVMVRMNSNTSLVLKATTSTVYRTRPSCTACPNLCSISVELHGGKRPHAHLSACSRWRNLLNLKIAGIALDYRNVFCVVILKCCPTNTCLELVKSGFEKGGRVVVGSQKLCQIWTGSPRSV